MSRSNSVSRPRPVATKRRHDQSRLREKSCRCRDHARQRFAARHGNHREADEADVLVVNTCAFIDSAKEESIDAILEAHQQRGLGKKPGPKTDRERLHGAALFARIARATAGGRRVHRARSGEKSRRNRGKNRGARFHLAKQGRRKLQTCATFRHRAPDLHSGLRHAALSPHAGTQRLPKNRGGLQSSRAVSASSHKCAAGIAAANRRPFSPKFAGSSRKA